MSRLAASSGRADLEVKSGDTRLFTCADGETALPYAILGKPDFASFAFPSDTAAAG